MLIQVKEIQMRKALFTTRGTQIFEHILDLTILRIQKCKPNPNDLAGNNIHCTENGTTHYSCALLAVVLPATKEITTLQCMIKKADYTVSHQHSYKREQHIYDNQIFNRNTITFSKR